MTSSSGDEDLEDSISGVVRASINTEADSSPVAEATSILIITTTRVAGRSRAYANSLNRNTFTVALRL